MAANPHPEPASEADALDSWFAEMREILRTRDTGSTLAPASSPSSRAGHDKVPPARVPPDVLSSRNPSDPHSTVAPGLPDDVSRLVPGPGQASQPDPAALENLQKLADDGLFRIKTLTKQLVTQRFANYAAFAAGQIKHYSDEAAKESAEMNEVAHIGLSLAFAFGGALVGPAVAAAGAVAAGLLKDVPKLAPIANRLQTAFETEVAKKTLDVGIEAMQAAARKGIVAATKSVPQTMVNYLTQLELALRHAGTALFKHVQQTDKPDGIAAIYSALEIKDDQAFEADLLSHLERFETQVAKRYINPATKQPGVAGGDNQDEAGNKGAAILIKGQRYFALVSMYHEQGSPQQLQGQSPMDTYLFLNWVDEDMKPYLPHGDLLFLKPDQVTRLPSGSPPEAARDASAPTEQT